MPNLLPTLPLRVVSAEDLHCHFHLRIPAGLANVPTKVVCAAPCAPLLCLQSPCAVAVFCTSLSERALLLLGLGKASCCKSPVI